MLDLSESYLHKIKRQPGPNPSKIPVNCWGLRQLHVSLPRSVVIIGRVALKQRLPSVDLERSQ